MDAHGGRNTLQPHRRRGHDREGDIRRHPRCRQHLDGPGGRDQLQRDRSGGADPRAGGRCAGRGDRCGFGLHGIRRRGRPRSREDGRRGHDPHGDAARWRHLQHRRHDSPDLDGDAERDTRSGGYVVGCRRRRRLQPRRHGGADAGAGGGRPRGPGQRRRGLHRVRGRRRHQRHRTGRNVSGREGPRRLGLPSCRRLVHGRRNGNPGAGARRSGLLDRWRRRVCRMGRRQHHPDHPSGRGHARGGGDAARPDHQERRYGNDGPRPHRPRLGRGEVGRREPRRDLRRLHLQGSHRDADRQRRRRERRHHRRRRSEDERACHRRRDGNRPRILRGAGRRIRPGRQVRRHRREAERQHRIFVRQRRERQEPCRRSHRRRRTHRFRRLGLPLHGEHHVRNVRDRDPRRSRRRRLPHDPRRGRRRHARHHGHQQPHGGTESGRRRRSRRPEPGRGHFQQRDLRRGHRDGQRRFRHGRRFRLRRPPGHRQPHHRHTARSRQDHDHRRDGHRHQLDHDQGPDVVAHDQHRLQRPLHDRVRPPGGAGELQRGPDHQRRKPEQEPRRVR
ncbi:MAG: hypothetical protein A4E73_00372 [Syntrophaceae bacterium PtaU1.Bin231]|nr:MAG: hypothetical protein A4E73_00372 [Syntrophaceae bacterium PtaU1.Bin231]